MQHHLEATGIACIQASREYESLLHQELLPSIGKEEKPDTDKKASTAAMKAWLVGLTKKKKDGPVEEPPAVEPEPVLVGYKLH